jgi:hypothetical protein
MSKATGHAVRDARRPIDADRYRLSGQRKRRLLGIMPTIECRLLYLDHGQGARA